MISLGATDIAAASVGATDLVGISVGATEVWAPAASGPLVSDTFNRADSTTSLGTADTGQVWTVPTTGAVWGISANRAYLTNTTAQSLAVVETGVADCTVSVTMPVVGDAGLCFRVIDDNNNFVLTASQLYKRVAGSFTAVVTFSTIVAGDRVSVVLSGATIVVKVNGADVASTTDTYNQTATRHGLRSHGATAPRFDDFTVAV